ncbi:MAG: SUMF1/EgtB/PvdO family nonheme iron enzyme [Armatimonas sp.]
MVKLVLVATAFVLGGIAQAQAPAPPLERTEPVKIGSELEKIAPYSGWKTHTGKVEDCLAVFTIETGEDSPITYITGVAVRCDGFLLVPVSVYDAVGRAKTKVRVTLSGAENEILTEPLKINGKPAHRSNRAELHVVKVSNHHIKSARLLDPVNLKPGTPVKILSAVPRREGVGRYVQEATVGQPGEKDAWGLTFPEGKAPEVLEAGSVVVDTESGAIVGMIPKAGSAPYSFDSLAYFNDNCAEVGLCPDRDAALMKAPKNGKMVRVAGGPVQVIDKDYFSRYRTEVACTPDFYCDTNLVSVHDYREWMDSKKSVPWPNSWTFRQAPNNPKDVGSWPVTGVRPEEIRWMAGDKAKRMLTWVEWERAAYSPDLSWLNPDDVTRNLAQQIENADVAFEQKALQRIQATRINRELAQQAQSSAAGSASAAPPSGGSAGRTRPVSRFTSAVAAARSVDISDLTMQWAQQLEQSMLSLFPHRKQNNLAQLRGPGWPHAVGSETKDKSVWDIFDMVTNVPEVVMDRGGTYRVVNKIAGAQLDPFISTVQWSGMALLGGIGAQRDSVTGLSRGQVGMTQIINAPIEDPLFWRAVYEARYGDPQILVSMDAQPLDGPDITQATGMLSRSYDVRPRIMPGFRLAR